MVVQGAVGEVWGTDGGRRMPIALKFCRIGGIGPQRATFDCEDVAGPGDYSPELEFGRKRECAVRSHGTRKAGIGSGSDRIG